MGSQRKSDDIGILNEKQIEKEILLTLTMLIGGTPVILYGEEINLNRVRSIQFSFCILFCVLFDLERKSIDVLETRSIISRVFKLFI